MKKLLKTRFVSVIGVIAIAAVIVFGMTACEEDSGWSGDTFLNGTWISANGKMIFNNGDWQSFQLDDTPIAKGTYTTSVDDRYADYDMYNETVTHIYGGSSSLAVYNLESKWYSRNELKSVLVPSKMTEDEFNDEFRSGATVFWYRITINALSIGRFGGSWSQFTRE